MGCFAQLPKTESINFDRYAEAHPNSGLRLSVGKTRRVKLQINAILIFFLAVLFYFFFMHAKHDSALSTVNAFADDPYDAVGSFGIQAAVFLGILCLIRAFRSNGPGLESVQRESFIVRAELAAILSVAITLAADAVAMLRHPHLWIGLPPGYRLLAWLGGMAILTAAVGTRVYRIARKTEPAPASPEWSKTIIVSFLAILILLLYPGNFRRGLIGVLATALIGAPVLFACMWAWTTSLIPFHPGDTAKAQSVAAHWYAGKGFQWAIVILAGVLIGLFFVAGEASEGTGIPPARLALVVSAYIGLETAGLIIGYAFLRKPLGLFRKFS
jgi:hypothetical protein